MFPGAEQVLALAVLYMLQMMYRMAIPTAERW